jgi:hypothetical protein
VRRRKRTRKERTKERKNRRGTKITKLIRRRKEHKFIWHPEYQHAAIFIEDTTHATKTSLSARFHSLSSDTAYDVSAQRLCKKIHESVSTFVRNVCNFTLHLEIAKCLYIYSVISCGSPGDSVLQKPGRDTLG